MSAPPTPLTVLERSIPDCTRCPELREYCADIARTKRRAFENDTYWGRPVPAFGDPAARVVIVGLAPAAHGANRTGRMFTGDRSGDFLFAGLHRVGFASQPEATGLDDGMMLTDIFITAAQRCAPPGNRPTSAQLAQCLPYLQRELDLLAPRVVICLGGIGWTAFFRALGGTARAVPRPRPKFGHGVEVELDGMTILGCYHVSQQNTFTGRLTPPMLDAVLDRARALASKP